MQAMLTADSTFFASRNSILLEVFHTCGVPLLEVGQLVLAMGQHMHHIILGTSVNRQMACSGAKGS
jgi:hypothetical protein